MGEILFEKTYSGPCEDMDDLNTFFRLSESSYIFAEMGEQDKILFNRFAAECALLAEKLECTLVVEHWTDGDECIHFNFISKLFMFSANNPLPFADLMKYNSLMISAKDDVITITATFFI